jgi:hypothetical protein
MGSVVKTGVGVGVGVVERPRRQVMHSPAYSAIVTNALCYTSPVCLEQGQSVTLTGMYFFPPKAFTPASHVWKLWAEKKDIHTGFCVLWIVHKFNSFRRGSFATSVPEKA